MHVGYFICLLLVAFSIEVVFYHQVSFASSYQHCFLDSCPEPDHNRMNQQYPVLECYNITHGCVVTCPSPLSSAAEKRF